MGTDPTPSTDTPDPVEIVAKAVFDTPTGARAALTALHAAGWRIVRFSESYENIPIPMHDPDGDEVLTEEWTPDA